MPVPKRKHHRSRRGKRRSHDHLNRPTWGKCSQCGEVKRPHCVCPNCGYYAQREVRTPPEVL